MSNNSMKFNGVDLGGASYNLILQDAPIPITAPSKLWKAKKPQAHGDHVKGAYLEPRVFRVKVVIHGTTFADFQTKVDNVKSVLSPVNGDCEIQFDYDSTRYYVGRLQAGLDGYPFGGRAAELDLEFFCADPLGYDPNETTVTNYDGTETIAYTGSALCPPVITGHRDTADIGATTSVENSTRSETCAVSYVIGQNNHIRFDGVREIVEVSDDDVTYLPIMDWVDADDYTFPLLQNGNNAFVLTGFTNTGPSAYSWDLVYRTRFL